MMMMMMMTMMMERYNLVASLCYCIPMHLHGMIYRNRFGK